MSSGRPTDKPQIEKLTKAHNVDRFDSGTAALNDYLKRFALVNQSAGGAQTYVAALGKEVVGYYSLSTGSVQFEEAPERTRKGLARHPVPVVLLARLARAGKEEDWVPRCCLTRFAVSPRLLTSSASAPFWRMPRTRLPETSMNISTSTPHRSSLCICFC